MDECIYNDFIIDFETLSVKPNSVLIDVSCIVFKEDFQNPPKFRDLIDSGIKVKFDLKLQKNRHKLKSTIDFWKSQSHEAKLNLKPSINDVDIITGTKQILDYLSKHKIDYWNSLGWCRGNSFDFPIFENIICELYNKDDTIYEQPINFSRQRDIRTAIEQNLCRMKTVCPLPKGTLDGFVKHDSIHDSAKDILMYLYSKRYAYGLEDIPDIDNTDIHSIK